MISKLKIFGIVSEVSSLFCTNIRKKSLSFFKGSLFDKFLSENERLILTGNHYLLLTEGSIWM